MGITGWGYHLETSYDRSAMSGLSLDWANQPNPYKGYPGLEPVPLPRDVTPPVCDFSDLLLGGGTPAREPAPLDIDTLSRIFLLTYSVTARARHGGGEFLYRSVASAGALFPSEIYVATRGVEGLADGLYHFSILAHGLNLLRKGVVSGAAVDFFLSAIFFRSSWKYRSRAYRYHLLDTGHVLEHLLLSLKSVGLPFSADYDFADAAVNRLLGLNERKEVTLARCSVPGAGSRAAGGAAIEELPEAVRGASRMSAREEDYPGIAEMHAAGNALPGPGPEPACMNGELGLDPIRHTRIEISKPWPAALDFAASVTRRRSRRNYVRRALPATALRVLLQSLAARDYASQSPPPEALLGIGLLVGEAEGLEPGFHLLDPGRESLGLVRAGDLTRTMAHVCLDQAWLANAGLHVLFLSNLRSLDRRWGARGYRYAMLTAGRLGERLYLLATALGLGCCGIGAFYDEEAAGLLGINAESRMLYLVAVGPVKSPGR